ncbi:uncharacterized protein LOC143465813 [Clavelina lepadiformis]|uniref:uncharacterized protein LOC143465813 n=1 Tax=Clavelina lepadiformis TaxID=159417 RepID=UPI004042EEF7
METCKLPREIFDEVTCPICFDVLKTPIRMLMCGHNFCQSCLASFLLLRLSEISCPTCREKIWMTPKGINEFPRNRSLENLIGKFSLLEDKIKLPLVPSLPPQNVPPPPSAITNGPSSLYGKIWYFGDLSRAQANDLLTKQGQVGDFIVRKSESKHCHFALSVRGSVRTVHFVMSFDSKKDIWKVGTHEYHSVEFFLGCFKKQSLLKNETLVLIKPFRRRY